MTENDSDQSSSSQSQGKSDKRIIQYKIASEAAKNEKPANKEKPKKSD